MRTLRFIVDGDTIVKDPSCDFNGLFPGSNSNIRAEFVFSPEWRSRTKVAAFWSMLNTEYEPQLLDEDNTCLIPKEALDKPAFKVQILGKYRGRIFKTSTDTVYQRGGVK